MSRAGSAIGLARLRYWDLLLSYPVRPHPPARADGPLLAFPGPRRSTPLPREPEREEHFVVEGPCPDGNGVGAPLHPPVGIRPADEPGFADRFRPQGGGALACLQEFDEHLHLGLT